MCAGLMTQQQMRPSPSNIAPSCRIVEGLLPSMATMGFSKTLGDSTEAFNRESVVLQSIFDSNHRIQRPLGIASIPITPSLPSTCWLEKPTYGKYLRTLVADASFD